MATGSLLVKAMLIYFGINLILYAGGIRVENLTSGESIFSAFVNVNSTESNPDITSNNVQYSIGSIGNGSFNPNVNEQTGGISGALSFIDALRAIRAFFNFLLIMFTGVFILFLIFPPVIQLFIGVPLAMVFIIGLVYFARSGQ